MPLNLPKIDLSHPESIFSALSDYFILKNRADELKYLDELLKIHNTMTLDSLIKLINEKFNLNLRFKQSKEAGIFELQENYIPQAEPSNPVDPNNFIASFIPLCVNFISGLFTNYSEQTKRANEINDPNERKKAAPSTMETAFMGFLSIFLLMFAQKQSNNQDSAAPSEPGFPMDGDDMMMFSRRDNRSSSPIDLTGRSGIDCR